MAARPTEETDSPFLYHENPEQKKKWETYDLAECGKWMLFFDNANLDEAWDKAKRLYDSGELTGIHSMKVSTSYNNPRASSTTSGVVIFYCGPATAEAAIMDFGSNLLTKMDFRYGSQECGRNRPPYIYYKSDMQTFGGTAATGQKKNHLYKIKLQ